LYTCFCDANPIARRAPFEAEFIREYESALANVDLDCVDYCGECNYGSTFRTAVVIDFGQEGLDNATGLEAYAQTIGDTFRDAINSLYKNDGKTCNPDF
jgi:hypothetical protein